MGAHKGRRCRAAPDRGCRQRVDAVIAFIVGLAIAVVLLLLEL
jgi:capsular polysaccharide biosynthesis protein